MALLRSNTVRADWISFNVHYMLDLTDNAISREHMSRLAANTGKPKRAALMHEQSEKLWHEAFRSMCKYVAMSHDDTISHIMQEL